MNSLKLTLSRHRADAAMCFVTVIWGFHFIVVKEALSQFAPVTFNAIRFSIGTPVILLIALRTPSAWHVPRRTWGRILLTTLLGSLGYQVLFVLGIKRTTSTNTALLNATSPTWTALFTIALGWVSLRRGLLVGIAITLGGVICVVLGGAESGLAFSHDDLTGSIMILVASVMAALSALISKSLVDQVGSMAMAVWSYVLTAVGLAVLAVPNLVTLSASDLPLSVWPKLLYSGLLSSVLGFLIWNYALKQIGPTRAATYNNITPIVAAVASITILGEPLTPALVAGGVLTLFGVVLVRRNIYLRRRSPSQPAAAPASAAGR